MAVRPDLIGWSADALSGLRGLKRKSGQKEASLLGRLLNQRRHVLAATTKKSSESLPSSSARFSQRAQRELNGAPVHTFPAFLRCTCLTKSTRHVWGRSSDSFDFGRAVCLQAFDVPDRRLTEASAVLPTELAHTFVADLVRRRSCV